MNTAPSTILVVDDEPRGRQLLEELLAPQGYRLQVATNGQEALALAGAHAPDLVLLDLMMPGLDGFEVCRRLRANPQLREVPIIMLTALDDRESRLKGLAAGADNFLTKPFDQIELRTRVATITRLNRYRLLLAERERFAQAIAGAPDGILIVDVNFQIRLANPAAHLMFRADATRPLPDEMLAKRVSVETAVLDQLKELMRGGLAPFQFVATGFLSDSVRFPIEASASRFTWAEQPALQIHLRDATEKRKLEEQFLRVQRLQGLGSLAGGVAHDLNNILAPLLNLADLLEGVLANRPEARFLQVMKNSVQRGSGLVKQILAFARGTGGEKQSIPPRYALDEIRRILSQTLSPNIVIRTDCPPETPPLFADPTHLHQMLMNLCVNARDAMPHGGQLKISAALCEVTPEQSAQWKDAKAGAWVRLSVADTGTGILPEVQRRLGEAFFTTKPVGLGTGLGLSTVFSILKSHGGFWRLHTQPGEGTTFELYLPIAPDSVVATMPTLQEPPHGRGELILVADDEVAMLEITRATLGCFGYRTVCARDGAEAVALFCQRPDDISLVMFDSQMPFMDGPAVLQALRKVRPQLKCVLTSASEIKSVFPIEGSLPPFLAKPFTSAQLLEVLDRELHTN